MHNITDAMLIRYKNRECSEEEYCRINGHLKGCTECKKKLMELEYEITYDEASSNVSRMDDSGIMESESAHPNANENYNVVAKIFKVEKTKSMTNAKRVGCCLIVLGLLILVSIPAVDNYMLKKAALDFEKYTYDVLKMPDEYWDAPKEELWGLVYGYKDEVKSGYVEFFADRNNVYEAGWDEIERRLDMQVEAYYEFYFDGFIEGLNIKIVEKDMNEAVVHVWNENIDNVISYERKNGKWLIKNIENKLPE